MHDRYQYLRHMYTCLFEAYKFGGTCFDPLLYYYPEDNNTYVNTEDTFIVGGAIKVSPILDHLNASTPSFNSYFPNGTWFDLVDMKTVVDTTKTGGANVSLTTDRLSAHVHLRAGSLIAFQDNSDNSTKVTGDLLKKPISLLVNRNENGYAYGTLFLDTGLQLEELEKNQYEYYQIHH